MWEGEGEAEEDRSEKRARKWQAGRQTNGIRKKKKQQWRMIKENEGEERWKRQQQKREIVKWIAELEVKY